jgi:SAM-dependent methyltransferase
MGCNDRLVSGFNKNTSMVGLMNRNLYVQYGCGWSSPSEWLNFDASPTLYFERIPIIGQMYTKNHARFPSNVRYGDIVKGLPIEPDSCSAVYCSHILEHLARDDFKTALRNTHRILRSGSVFRLVLPDLKYLALRYVNSDTVDAAEVFMRESGLGYQQRRKDLKGLLLSWLGNSQHLWMWDWNSIAVELNNSGFSDIRRAYFGDYEDQKFRSVEDEARWNNCLGVQCKKFA